MRTANFHLVNGETLTFDMEGLKVKNEEEGYVISTQDNRKIHIFRTAILYIENKDEIDIDKRI